MRSLERRSSSRKQSVMVRQRCHRARAAGIRARPPIASGCPDTPTLAGTAFERGLRGQFMPTPHPGEDRPPWRKGLHGHPSKHTRTACGSHPSCARGAKSKLSCKRNMQSASARRPPELAATFREEGNPQLLAHGRAFLSPLRSPGPLKPRCRPRSRRSRHERRKSNPAPPGLSGQPHQHEMSATPHTTSRGLTSPAGAIEPHRSGFSRLESGLSCAW
jgi:hypothetical protein